MRDLLIFLGGLAAWISILSQFFISPNSVFGKDKVFIGPYTYIFSLIFIVFIFNKKKIYIDGGIKIKLYGFVFIVLSIIGVLWGMLLFGSVVNSPNSEITPKYYQYGGHYFFSSIIFYLIFFRLNKKFMGVTSKIIYWLFMILLTFALIVIFFSS
jgi:hypothetical protein